MFPLLKITKLEAARRQLATAIVLWFYERDQVSIHTLAAAAYEVIHSVSSHRGRKRELLFDTLVVSDGDRKQLKDALRKPANFFKHGDRDPDEIIEFAPVISEYFILYCIAGLESIGIPKNMHELTFTRWFDINHADLLTQAGKEALEISLPIDALEELRSLSKIEFFQMSIQA